MFVWRRSRRSRDTSHFSTTSPKNGKVHSVVCFGVLVSACSAVSWCGMSGCIIIMVFLFVMAVPLCSEICSQFEFGGLCTELDLGFKWINFNVMNQVRIFTMSAHSVAIYVCVCVD